MTPEILKRGFFERATLGVARDLLGCFLVRKMGRTIVRARITETEAYIGEDDLACHASKGRTARTRVMYGEPGHAYVYLVYGLHHMLNIVTEPKDFPAAVLIRAVDIESIPREETNGPGKLTRALRISRRLNGWDMTQGEELWVESFASKIRSGRERVLAMPRIGIDYAGEYAKLPWRFTLSVNSRIQCPFSRSLAKTSLGVK